MGQQYSYSQEKSIVDFYIDGDGAILLFFIFTKTLNLSDMKYKLAYLNKYLSMKR